MHTMYIIFPFCIKNSHFLSFVIASFLLVNFSIHSLGLGPRIVEKLCDQYDCLTFILNYSLQQLKLVPIDERRNLWIFELHPKMKKSIQHDQCPPHCSAECHLAVKKHMFLHTIFARKSQNLNNFQHWFNRSQWQHFVGVGTFYAWKSTTKYSTVPPV